MVFVSVKCALITVGALAVSVQVTGGVKLSVDRNVNPGAFVGQERMSAFPLGFAFKVGSSGAVPMSATV